MTRTSIGKGFGAFRVAMKDLSGAVRVAAETCFGGSRGLRASTEIAESVTSHDIDGRKKGETMSLELSPAGAVLKEEKDED